MKRFTTARTTIDGLILVERQKLEDDRGSLTRLFCAEELGEHGWIGCPEQINHTYTRRPGTVRGLHFQFPPHAEIKLVSCIRGEVWDVAVDLRTNSPTFRRWHAERLSADNRRALLIPAGFAHGFQALTPDAELIYCHSARYQPGAEGGINVSDPALAIAWPLPIHNMSDRDRNFPLLTAEFSGLAS
jgi:dTDP-4-dehydrorhamnose 3,5-epimerase